MWIGNHCNQLQPKLPRRKPVEKDSKAWPEMVTLVTDQQFMPKASMARLARDAPLALSRVTRIRRYQWSCFVSLGQTSMTQTRSGS